MNIDDEKIQSWLERLEGMDIDSSVNQIDFIPVTIYQSQKKDDRLISQKLCVDGTDLVFERHGFKDPTHDRWVDNIWFFWEFVEST